MSRRTRTKMYENEASDNLEVPDRQTHFAGGFSFSRDMRRRVLMHSTAHELGRLSEIPPLYPLCVCKLLVCNKLRLATNMARRGVPLSGSTRH